MSDVGVAELARQVRDVLTRFQSLADRLDSTYMSKEYFKLYQDLMIGKIEVNAEKLRILDSEKASKAEVAELRKQLDEFKGNNTWIFRTIAGALIVAVIGIILVAGGYK